MQNQANRGKVERVVRMKNGNGRLELGEVKVCRVNLRVIEVLPCPGFCKAESIV